MAFELPECGLVFWPVGNGDSTSIVVDSETCIQIDLNHLEKSEDDNESSWAVVDELIERLPRIDGRPYLNTFALTHPDQDHCRGFSYLLKEVEIGELWFTPRVFGEYSEDLCDDAKAFKDEAERRVKETIEADGDPGAGNRIRLFGYSEILEEDDFKNFPSERLTAPGNEVTTIDEKDMSGVFRAFVHAPFKDDDQGDRNDTSLGLQIVLYDGSQELRALLLGDLSYPILKRIFDVSEAEDIAWNVLLAPHHCSKAAMYWKDEGEDAEKLKKNIVDKMDEAALEANRIVSSSNPVPSSNKPGDNPPHAKAKTQYEGITESFICTMDQENPVVAEIVDEEIVFAGAAAASMSASEAADLAQGTNETPATAHTYGRSR